MFDTFNNIFLKMTWLSNFFDVVVYQWFGLQEGSLVGRIIQFFLYDVVKIFILLTILIFLVSLIQSYFTPERTTVILQKYKGIKGNITGALLGTLTPFCSCSSIPIFIGFTRAGLPLGITFSFLISSPLVDLASFIILLSALGWEIAVIYVIVGIVLAVIGGMIIDKNHMEEYIADYLRNARHVDPLLAESMTWNDRFHFALDQVKDIIKRVWLYIIIGVLIGASIHNLEALSDFVKIVLGNQNPFSVIIATVLGVPMYADIFGTIPVAEALFAQGIGAGTILSYMMAVTTLSIPSMILLKQVLKPKLLTMFIIIVTIGIIIIGYIFNILYYFM
ncbi:permease [Candidatus Xianfuyuplasma coldseepsis]|uniref:Permease n=1 Tax=Candidatus Xianfuyuplasma coldseepsis TaxID=2782163 RepID=A0A7L7KQZ2_9MOLU|nr:permease [Xianfuyuplasma coldseepsis]QMS84636.1 permease [Xianfuyuplasma coldseepsis]